MSQADRALDAERPEGAMGHDHGLTQPEQDRAARPLGIELIAKRRQLGLDEQPSQARMAPVSVLAVDSSTFRATLPVKPSVTITSAPEVGRSKPSTLPANSIPSSQCMVCHMHQPNIFLNSYLGYTMWDYESDADLMWPGPENRLDPLDRRLAANHRLDQPVELLTAHAKLDRIPLNEPVHGLV